MVLGRGASMLCYSSAGAGLGVGENPESKYYVGQEWCAREVRAFRGKSSRSLMNWPKVGFAAVRPNLSHPDDSHGHRAIAEGDLA